MITNIPGIFRQYKYVLDIFTVIIGDEVIEIDTTFVNSIGLEKDYDNLMFPVLRVVFSMDDELYYKIIENKENVQYKVRLMKYIYDENQRVRSKQQFIHDVFISFIEEESDRVNRNYTRHNESDEMAVASKSLEVFLFKKKDLLISKEYINGIFNNVAMTDLLTYILSSSGVKQVLLSPLHNIEPYSEIRIPPMTFVDTLDYLENIYGGYYDYGSIKFFDYDCLYFIDKGSKNNVYRSNEFVQTVLTIQDLTTPTSVNPGCSLDNVAMKTYINVSPKAFRFISSSITNEHIHANNAIIISPTTGDMVKVEPPVKEVTGKVYKLLIDRYNNKRAVNNYAKKVSENGNLLNIAVTGVDVSSFTPNKDIQVIFEDSKLNRALGGGYRISRLVFEFRKEGKEFTIAGELNLKRRG